MNSAWKSYGCIFVAGCLWGTNGLFVKLMQGAGSTSAYTGFVRIALSLLILTVITLVKEGPKAFKISKNTLILRTVRLGLSGTVQLCIQFRNQQSGRIFCMRHDLYGTCICKCNIVFFVPREIRTE